MSLLSNVMFFTSVLSSIPFFLKQNAKTQENIDRTGFLHDQYGSPFVQDETFDYIVVGGGSAGSVVTSRLSSDPGNSVLLLDIGGDPDPIQDVPMYAPIQVTPDTDFQYFTVPQDNSFHSTDKRYYVVRGKGLGGSGNLNYMVYQRGSAAVYDEWAALTGDRIWSWNRVLHFFKKFEAYFARHEPIDTRYHNSHGEAVVTSPTFTPSAEYFFAACEEMGCNIEDLNTGVHNAPVFDLMEFNIKGGKRWGPYQAFLRPVLGRPNLKVYRYARVIKVNVDADMHATSVTYIRHGVTRTVTAHREIILCAGTIDSPKILMLSGIGPREHLEELNIPVLKNLPVGKNLQEHVGLPINRFEFTAKNVAYDPARDLTPSAFLDYVVNGTGPLSTPIGVFAIGYYSTSQNPNPEIPDIQHAVIDTYGSGNPFVVPQTPLVDSLAQTTLQPDSNTPLVALGTPYSVFGEVKLASANPEDKPLIDPKFFSDERDMPRLIEGVKYIIGIYENSATYAKLGAQLVLTVPEMCRNFEFRSDAFWDCYIRFYTGGGFHSVGTCRMGRADDPRSVVDSNLRVIGIQGLRVVDGSVMPKIVNCNAQTPIFMIAELASHLILEDQIKSSNLR